MAERKHHTVEIEFDAAKDQTNLAKHGISLRRAADFELITVIRDERRDYGELRYRAWGTIEGTSYSLVFTYRGLTLRPISLRRAHAKEIKRYAKQDTR